jgi:hypothetical protein
MDIYALIAENFEVTKKDGWSSFRHPLAQAAFGSSRIGKIMPSGVVLFTFGETIKGKRLGLSARLVEVIEGAGLAVMKVPSTAGQKRDTTFYTGFDPSRATKEQVRNLISQVLELLHSTPAN